MPDKPLVGILLFDEVEVLDWAGPYEVFSRAAGRDGEFLFRTLALAPTRQVTCAGGLVVMADATLADSPGLDILVVPGGPGARDANGQEPLWDYARGQKEAGTVVAWVCTGSYILARAGLLDGLTATTHTLRLADFAAAFPAVRAVHEKIVDRGQILTAGGVSSGVDLALHLLARLFGEDARSREAARLDGPWS